ncbi:MAG TPA: sensor domain-containing diguanylate cyclase [Candidatus Limnocylindrales bacterium]|nr:sensor domain-containing diguanylate cyclase [Candidatus Limnocylindrales bacterium]
MVITIVAVLALVAGGVVAAQIANQMRAEADERFDAHAAVVTAAVQDTMDRASSDIRLARRDETFELALLRSDGPLPLLDRLAVEKAITYLGDRYQVDEICVIRASGLEAARWVNGAGVAPLEDLSPDERTNNPAVVPTLPLADDSFYQTEPYVSADSGRWVIGVATPIISASGTHLGILHMEIPIAKFASVLAALGFTGDSYNVLLDSEGHLLVHPQLAAFRAAANAGTDPDTAPFPMATATGSQSWRDAVGRMVAEPTGAAEFTDNGRSMRVSWQAVPGSDRIVASVVPTTELYADADRMILNLGLTAGPLVLLMILISAWFARRMASAYAGLSGLNDRLALTNQALEETSRASTDLARESAIVNQFTELTALTEDDISLSVATLATLDELVHPDDASLHVSNQSQDRAVTQATLGGRKADVLSLHELGRCPAVRRSSLYVTDDISERLAYRCPVYRVDTGTLACVPLVALGETVGAVHLHWGEPRDLSLELRLALTRVSEHAALSLANRRLLLALRGQANTDGRTGLTNSRAFDETVQRRLQLSDSGKAAILMLDLDHFKEFNDRYGHPAGDEALRVFAHILGSSIREHDVAARYGGEEFAVYLSGLDEAGAQEVAERIRERTESTIIPLGPGKTGRLTVSIGIAVAPDDGTERSMVLKAADAALYKAKLAGRNRVVSRLDVLEPGSARTVRTARSRTSHRAGSDRKATAS